MDHTDSSQRTASDLLDTLRGCARRFAAFAVANWTGPVPDYQPGAAFDDAAVRLSELERVLDLLEQTKLRIADRGWTAGGWFSVEAIGTIGPRTGGTGGDRPAGAGTDTAGSAGDPVLRYADHHEQRALLRRPSGAGAACLIGSMLLLAEDQDTAHSLDDVRRAGDELYEAAHERAGHASFAPGHRFAANQRRAHLRVLTAWNDEPGRTQGDVIDLLNRGISRTIAACVA